MQTQEKKTTDDNEKAKNENSQLVTTQSHASPFRTRIWRNLFNVKFKALYAHECSKLAGLYTRVLSFLLALTSASSVAAWTLWQEHKTMWAVIIGVGQVLLIAVPFIPFLKSEREYLTMSFDFESLYLKYEQLWYDFEDKTIDEAAAKTRISALREKEVEIEKSGVRCPRTKRWTDRINSEAEAVIKLDLV